MENIARPLEKNEFNTLSAAMTMLALDVYASSNASAVEKLGIDEVDAKGHLKSIAAIQNKLLQAGVTGAGAGLVDPGALLGVVKGAAPVASALEGAIPRMAEPEGLNHAC